LYQWIEELDYQEIADVLGIGVTNVATKSRRLKQALRQEAGVKYRTG